MFRLLGTCLGTLIFKIGPSVQMLHLQKFRHFYLIAILENQQFLKNLQKLAADLL